MSFVIMELKPAEVEYLNSMWRCRHCDHLMALHHASHYKDGAGHCANCDPDEECDGPYHAYEPDYCLISGCPCGKD